MQAVAIVDCRGGNVVAVQEGPGLAISTAAAAARRVGALLRQSTADPKQQKFDAITGDHTAPASAGQLEFQSRGLWAASYRRCGDVYVAALYRSCHGMTAAEAAALSSKASKFLWRVSSGERPRTSTISRLGPGLYSGLRRILNGQDWQSGSGGYLLSPFGSVPPPVFCEAILPEDHGNVSQWSRQKEAYKQLEGLQKQIESSVARADLLPLATEAAGTGTVSAGDFFSSSSSSAVAVGVGVAAAADADAATGEESRSADFEDGAALSTEASFFGDADFQKDDGGEKEQSFFPDDAFAMGAAAAAVATAAAPIDSSSSFGFDDSVFGSDNKDSNDTQFESSAFGNESAGFKDDDFGAAPSTTQQSQTAQFDDSFFGSGQMDKQATSSSQSFGFDDSGFGPTESTDAQPLEVASFASFDSGTNNATNGGGAAAGAVAGAAAGAAAVAFGVLPLAKKSKIKLLAKLEETASAEFSNGQIKKSSILATVSIFAKKGQGEEEKGFDDSSHQFVEAEKDQDLMLTLDLPHSGVSSQGIRASKSGVSAKKPTNSQVSICVSKDVLETVTSTGRPLSVLKYRLASPFLFLPVAIACFAKFDDFKANVDIITRCNINPEFKGAIESMTVSLSVGSWLAPLKTKPRANFSSARREISWDVRNLSPGSTHDLKCQLSVLASAPGNLEQALSGAVRAKIKDVKSHVTYSVLRYDNFEQSGVSEFNTSPNNYSSTVVVMP